MLVTEVNGTGAWDRPRRRYDLNERGYEWSIDTQNLANDGVLWRGGIVRGNRGYIFITQIIHADGVFDCFVDAQIKFVGQKLFGKKSVLRIQDYPIELLLCLFTR